MGFLELVKRRQSVREYLDSPVEREKIEHCLEAARLAPSACNSQPWKFIVVDEPELRQAIARQTFGKVLSFNHFSMHAPVLVLVIRERMKAIAQFGAAVKNRPFSLIDVGIAAEHFCLQAAEEGLGTCMLGWFESKPVGKIIGIPKNKRVELIITVGYPKSAKIRDKKRKSIDKMRNYNRYS